MYLPAHFRVEDFDELAAFIEENSFATLVTFDGVAPFATHLPLLFDKSRGERGTLSGHLARGNAQWQHLQHLQENGGEALAIFHGPHTYISPSWYGAQLAVPTWNYVALHAYGTVRLVDDAELEAQLRSMIQKYESGFPTPWSGDLPAEFLSKMRLGIVGFAIGITRLEGKWKLNQNRSAEDRNKVIEALENSSHDDDRAIAALMKNP